MQKHVLGIVLIVIGVYLLVINPILSIIFNYADPIGYSVPESPENYWMNWLNNYGVMTFGIAGVGLCVLIIGIHYLLKNRNTLNSVL